MTPEQIQELKNLIDKLQSEGMASELVQQEVDKKKADFESAKKPQPVAEIPAPAAGDTTNMELPQETGSLDSPKRKSVRGQVRQRELENKEEEVLTAEKGFYEATKVNEQELYNTEQQELIEEFKVADKPVIKPGVYGPDSVEYIPASQYTGNKKAIYENYLATGNVELSDDYFADKIYKEKNYKATTYIDNLPTGIKNSVEKNVKQNEALVNNRIESINLQLDAAGVVYDKISKKEPVTEQELEVLNSAIKSFPKIKEDFDIAIEESKDVNFAVDYFKRSYRLGDQVEAALKTTALEVGTGLAEFGNMLAKNKDYESDVSRYMTSVLAAHRKDIAENLEKPISVEDIKADGNFMKGSGTFISQMAANQTPYLLALGTGAAAPYVFGAIGTTSRLAEFSMEEKEARENISNLQNDLLLETDDNKIAEIKSEIEKYQNITTKNDGLKLLTSVGHGAAEMIDGYTDRWLLGGIKKAWTKIPADEFKKSYNLLSKSYGAGVLTETASESATQVAQNAFDIWFDGQDKSYYEGLPDAAAGGFIMGNGFKSVETLGIARNIAANVAADKEAKQKVNLQLEKISRLEGILKDTNASEASKVEAKKQKTKEQKELNRLNDVTLARLAKLTLDQQKDVFDLDRKARGVNRRWRSIATDSSLSESEKDALKQSLEEEFDGYQDKKRGILQTAAPSNKLVDANKVKEEGFFEGDLIRELDDANVSLQKVKAHNDGSNYVKNIVEVSDQDLESIEEFVSTNDSNDTIDINNQTLNYNQAKAIAEGNKGRNGMYDSKSSVIAIMPQRGRMDGKSLASIAVHEYTHAALNALGIPKSEFAGIKDDLTKTIEDSKLSKKQKETVLNDIKLYEERVGEKVKEGALTEDQAAQVRGEEIFTTIGDVITQGLIRGSKKQSFLDKLSVRMQNILGKRLDAEVVDGLQIDSADGVLDFVTRFQKDVFEGVKTSSTKSEGTAKSDSTNAQDLGSEITSAVKFEDESINEQFKSFTHDGKVNNAPSDFHITAAYQYEPLARAVVNSLAAKGIKSGSAEQNNLIMDYLEDFQNKEELVNQLVLPADGNEASSLVGLAKTFDPKIGSFGGYAKGFLGLRAIRQLENKMKKSFIGSQKIDAPESKQIEADEKQIEISKPTVDKLNIKGKISEDVGKLTQLATISAGNALSGKNISDLKKINVRDKAFGRIFERKLFNDIKDVMGKNTKNSNEFSSFLNSNYPALLDAAMENIDFKKGSGPASDWDIDNTPSKEEFVEYYEAKNEKPSTRADRKKSLNNAIARSISNDARIEFVETDPKVAELFKEEHGVPLGSEITLPGKGKPTKLSQIPSFQDGTGMPAKNVWKALGAESNIGFNLSDPKGQKRAVSTMKTALLQGLPIDPFISAGLIINSSPRFFPKQEKEYKKAKENLAAEPNNTDLKKALQEASENRVKIKNDFTNQMDSMLNELKNGNKVTYLTGAAKGWTKSKYSFNKNGTTLKDINASLFNGKTAKNNAANLSMFEQTMKPLYEMLAKDPEMVNLAMMLTNTSNGGSNLWFRLGAEVVGASDLLLPSDSGKRGIEWEHAMQANNARLFLFESAKKKVPWNTVYPAVKRNYKVIALDKSLDNILKAAKRSNAMPKDWDVYTGHWTQRYFDPVVASFGGIDPASINYITGNTLADEFKIDINGKSTEAPSLGSEVLSNQFNEMLQRVKGIAAEATYSEARAIKLGKKNNPYKFFVPYSAEDYLGLVYPTLGRGKEGDANLKWYKENITDVYARGIRDFEIAKQQSMNQWADLKKQIKNTPAKLGKEAVRDFSNEEAIRLYLWDKQNMLPDNVAKKDIEAINKYINSKPELKSFAEQIQNLTADGYPEPTGDWLAGTITTDLVNYTNTASRDKHLAKWQENVDAVYSKDNMNKLQSIYGEDYTEALSDMLYRMKTGRNRPTGSNKLTNQFMNWVNDSVGTIMFFNTRSALLQTISAVNYLNFTDNNPLRVAAAFANQKQYWSDFSEIFNSDFLKQRRGGLKTDVNADEIARAAASSDNKVRAALAAILKKGFLPTQLADSFAISLGGAAFYRNRVRSLMKDGVAKEQAEEQAFLDFKETTEESQQSSRPDRVSMQQSSPLGRVVLAFANTPMQYTRLTKKAALDLVNGRGDWKTNLSKLAYYGAVQNIIFTALQSAMFAMLFSDEEDDKEKEKIGKIGNGIADTLLRGSGVHGAGVVMLKNIVMEAIKQYNSGRPDYTKAASRITSISPPVDSKIRKLQSVGRTFTYKQELEKMRTKGFDIDNPAYMAVGQTVSALANIPLDRAIRKMNNLKVAVDQDTETWQSIGLALGYSEWDLGIIQERIKKEKELKKAEKAKKAFMRKYGPKIDPKLKRMQAYQKMSKEERKEYAKKRISKGLPLFKKDFTSSLPKNVLGRANRDGTIEVANGLSPTKKKQVIAHEEKHQQDMKSGKLDYDKNFIYWGKEKYKRTPNKKIDYKGKLYVEGSPALPWEKAANKAEKQTN